MINCPNCGAPITPYSYKCEYCGTYVFDTCSWDLDSNKPCYIRFKINNKIITALAKPKVDAITIDSDTVYASDGFGNPMATYHTNKTCDINMKFECIEDRGNNFLFRIQT